MAALDKTLRCFTARGRKFVAATVLASRRAVMKAGRGA
jgi:hypothetical protein